MHNTRWVKTRLVLILTGLIGLISCSNPNSSLELSHKDNLLVMCQSSCNTLSSEVSRLGGQVKQQYQSINAMAISLPAKFSKQFSALAGVAAVRKDQRIIRPPSPKQHTINANATLGFRDSSAMSTTLLNPSNYSFNNAMLGAAPLHENGVTGSGVIVAVIDSGTANNAEVVPALAGSVIGGENFVDGPDEPSATSTANDFHGTAVASMISAHVGVVLDNSSELLQSVATHAPDSVIPVDDTSSMIPMVGSAPEASLYAMKVFPANGDGTPSSIVLAALDRALTLKKNFNNGVPSEPVSGDGSEDNPYVYDSLNIEVVNMSLGGLGMVAGLEFEDILAREMLKEGILVVTSAGNEGFSAMTVGSPGTSVATVTVGATMTPQHERILRDLRLGPGIGALFRPNDILQTAYFSSRGPTADGRKGVNVVANGFGAFVQGADGSLMLISGTSFSSPSVAGTAALLRQANPQHSAAQIRDSLIQNANPGLLPRDSVVDQGMGFVDVSAANSNMDSASADIPPLPIINEDEPVKVKDQLEDLNIPVIRVGEGYETNITLQPGEPLHLLVETRLRTASLSFEFTAFNPELPIEQQNLLFDDALLFNVADGPVTTNNFVLDERILDNQVFELSKPQTGLVRVALLGDWTNAGAVSTVLRITEQRRRLEKPFADGKLRDEETDRFEVEVEADVSQLNFELSWESDWGHYPPHDIDLIVLDPNGVPYFDAATLDAPERLSIDDPVRGDWTVFVTGYNLHGFKDEYELRITDQDNSPLED